MIGYLFMELANSELNENKKNNTEQAEKEPLYDLSLLTATGRSDDEFLLKLVALFIDIMPENVKELKIALAGNQIEETRRAAHKMKSSVELWGIVSLRDTLKALESISEVNAEAHSLANHVEATINKVIADLKQL